MERSILIGSWDQFGLNCYFRRFLDTNWLGLRLEGLQHFGIEVRPRLEVFPCKDAIVARRDAAEVEPAILIRCCSLIKVLAVPKAFGNDHD